MRAIAYINKQAVTLDIDDCLGASVHARQACRGGRRTQFWWLLLDGPLQWTTAMATWAQSLANQGFSQAQLDGGRLYPTADRHARHQESKGDSIRVRAAFDRKERSFGRVIPLGSTIATDWTI